MLSYNKINMDEQIPPPPPNSKKEFCSHEILMVKCIHIQMYSGDTKV